ncbi:hypothetical protein [Gemmata sp.]|uniref:hypothetical protein n=1 Tax=Gemmata sp. TaxID=1914242 RepID=UPI003F707751
MTPAPAPIILQHGTTLRRAQEIAARGPDPQYVEPNSGRRWDPPGFSTARTDRPFGVGSPDQYARLKAANFPNEGGPAVLEIEVPPDIIAVLESDPDARDAMDSGDTLFDPRTGMTELLAAWPPLVKRIIRV